MELQTFLPYSDFEDSVASLDRQRLGKQRVETLQIMQTLLGVKVGNTTRQEPTGNFRYVCFDDDGSVIDDISASEIERLISLGYDYDEVPITRTVHNPQGHWSIHVNSSGGWANHPAVRMWRGFEWLLMQYQIETCKEWTRRGYKDTCLDKTYFIFNPFVHSGKIQCIDVLPTWLGDSDFHRSHQSNLVRKFPEHYRPQFPDVPDNLPYIWPSESE